MRIARLLLPFVFLFSLACASVPVRDRIIVSSEPPAATVLLDGNPVGRTPFSLKIRNIRPRSIDHTIVFRKEGFRDSFHTIHTVHEEAGEAITLIVLFPIWLLAKIIDSDAFYKLEDKDVYVVLQPIR